MSSPEGARPWWEERLQTFVLALAVRVVVGWVFFGCVDMWSNIDATRFMAAGKPVVVPYLPGIQLLIWLGGVLAMKTSLPLTFCYKICQIVFDAGNAVLVYDAVRRRTSPSSRAAFTAGLLYAASPVAIFVSAFHAQWDPIFLFFVLLAFSLKDAPSLGWRFAAGFFFVVGVIVKPIPLLLAPLLLSLPNRTLRSVAYARGELAKLAGALACLAIYFVVAGDAGYPVIDALPKVASYAKEGYPLLGLPVEIFHKNRYWLLGGVGIVTLAYLARKVDAYGASLLIFALLVGTCGLAPQYLLWPIPFALIGRRHGFLAAYGALAATFMFLFFGNPHSSPVAYENMATFATVKQAKWLVPSIADTERLLAPMHFVGDWAVPICALLFVAFVVVRALAVRAPSTLAPPPPHAERDHVARFAPWTCLALVAVLFVAGAFVKKAAPAFTVADFEARLAVKTARYEVAMAGRYYSIPNSYESKPPGSFSILTVAGVWIGAWSLAALGLFGASWLRARRERAPRDAAKTSPPNVAQTPRDALPRPDLEKA